MSKSPFSHGPSGIHRREDVRCRVEHEKERIGLCLRAHRRSRGLSRVQAAECIGIHPAHLAKIERGEANVTISTLTAVAVAYGLSVRSFFVAPPSECDCV